MKIIDSTILAIDRFQQKHPILGLPIGVIKRYGENDAGHQAALITYYGFLSLFPLLLVFTSIAGLASGGSRTIQGTIMDSINSYFPVIGEQLARNIQASNKSGIALVIGLVVTFYGARGGVDAFRTALNHLWHIPKKKRVGFPLSILVSAGSLVIGGIGLTSAAILSGAASGLGQSMLFKVLAAGAALLILVPTFYWLFKLNLNTTVAKRNLQVMALYCSIGIVVMQALGSYLVTRQLRTLSPLYGTFALVLGLLFWIYLQATVVLYIVQVRIIRSRKLWPRSISGKLLTTADKQLLDNE